MSVNAQKLQEISLGLHLLYVEDDPNVQQNTLAILNEFFTDITIASNGQEALDFFQKNHYDLIISDIEMPLLNGLDMAQKIRDMESHIPIILISAHNENYFFEKAIELDIDSFVVKPLIFNHFLKALYKTVYKIKLISISENYQKNLEEEIAKRNAEIEHKLLYDPLTELLSRYSFFHDLKSINLPVVIMIDINEFHVINEVYGSNIGSVVLQRFAQILQELLIDTQYKAYRLSADEFAIVDDTTFIDPDKYQELIDELFHQLDNLKLKIEEYIISINITIGLSTVENNCYESAKIALDYAKKTKKPFVMYSSQIDHRKERSQTLQCRDDISSAIDEERVLAVYQPIVNQEGQIIKYETLMRLKDKESVKLMSPYYFLDVAIKTRLYEQLSSTVIFDALRTIASSEHTISMNFTYGDIRNAGFLKEIERFFKENNEVGHRAVFEITESESIENYDDVKSFIARFRKYGVKIAIDDFGSGFSNFEYILEIEPDYLKIDGSLIKDIDTNERSHTLVEAIVQFSHKLGITVIAEFVHSEIIFQMLKKLDVDEYQGFYFSEPLEQINN